MMLKTFSSLGCSELDLPDVVALAKRHGISAVELRSVYGTMDLPTFLVGRFGEPAAWAAWLREQDIGVCALDTSFRLIGGDEASRAELLAFAPWAEAAGVPWLRVFDGGKSGDAAEIAESAGVLDWWRAEQAKHGWKVGLMIETHDALVTSDRLRALFAAAPEAALLWDAHHTWKKGGEDPVATWEVVNAHTVHVHVKDSVSRPSARHPFTYVLPGDGEFPMRSLLETLLKSGYNGPLSLEWERQWHPYLADLDTALRVAAERRWW